MKNRTSAKRFAKIFLNIAGPDKAESAVKELSIMNEIAGKSKDFKGLLLGPQFTQAEKEKTIKKIGEIFKLSDTTTKFITYLSQKAAIGLLVDISAIANALYLESRKKSRAVVFTPAKITKETEVRLHSALKKLTERDVDLNVVIDPSFIGGILVKVGSTMYDTSIRGQLKLLKAKLIK